MNSSDQKPPQAMVVPKPCTQCGKPNPPDADWCWVCYAAMDGSGPYMSPALAPDDDESKQRQSRRLYRRGIQVVLYGLLAFVVAKALVAATVVIFFGITIIAAVIAFWELCGEMLGG